MIRVISGIYKGRVLSIPSEKVTRPTMDKVRQAIFSIISKNIEDSVFLDLFAGSGAVGIEAVSRGAKKVYFNEKNISAYKVIEKNISSLDIEDDKYVLFLKDYRLFLKKHRDTVFDIVFLDPPYRFKVNRDIILYMRENSMLSKEAIIISEQDEKNKDIDGFEKKEYTYSSKCVSIYRRIAE